MVGCWLSWLPLWITFFLVSHLVFKYFILTPPPKYHVGIKYHHFMYCMDKTALGENRAKILPSYLILNEMVKNTYLYCICM